jgi:hypothetical protein
MLTWMLAMGATTLSAIRDLTKRIVFSIFALLHRLDYHLSSESGEGVISTAIIVVVMAFLAVGLWIAFKGILSSATSTVTSQVSSIGQ